MTGSAMQAAFGDSSLCGCLFAPCTVCCNRTRIRNLYNIQVTWINLCQFDAIGLICDVLMVAVMIDVVTRIANAVTRIANAVTRIAIM